MTRARRRPSDVRETRLPAGQSKVQFKDVATKIHPTTVHFTSLTDCLTYAVAKLSGRPLLCVGDDFAQTDLPLA